jgi:DNA repair exonuclease SbcCD ATPase subunit
LLSIIAGARRSVRRDAFIAISAGVAAIVPAALLIAWLAGAPEGASKLPLLIDLLALGLALALAFFATRRWLHRISNRNIAAAAESRLGFAEGELQSVIEMQNAVPVGTSKALWERTERGLASRLSSESVSSLSGAIGNDVRRRRRHFVTAGVLLLVATIAVAFVSPERSRAAWSPLLKPVSTMSGPDLPPIEVSPGDASVSRGSQVEVKIRAPQREAVVLYYRQQGDVLQEETLVLNGDAASFRIRNVDAATRYWVRAPDGAVSDTFRITPADPLLLASLRIEVVYPSYLGRAPESFDKDVPALELPAGTQLRIAGRATQRLRSVGLQFEQENVMLDAAGATFSGTWTPRTSGLYTWLLNGDASSGIQPIEIQVVGDAAPEVEVTFPGVDTLISPDLRQLVVADARDDYGVIAATLVSWRTSKSGQREAPIEQALSLEGDVDQKLIRGVLDATGRRLLPGDTISYFVRVIDNSPARKVGVSRTYTLRVPGTDELRERVQSETDDLMKDADKLARAMRELESRTRDLQRKSTTSSARQGQRGSGGTPGNDGKQLSNEQVEQARELMERQQAMTSEMEQLRDRLEAMEQAAQRAGLQDPEMQKQLDEMRKLFDQLLSPEMKKQLEDMRKALENLSAEDLQKALEQMAKQQEEMKKQLEQSLEMLRRAATEQELTALSQEAKELATKQDALSEQMKQKQGDPKENVEKQEDLAKDSNKLAEALAKLRRKMSEQGENTAAGKTGEAQKQTEEARDAMNDAAKKAQGQNTQDAGKSGEQAADKLNEAAESLDKLRAELSKSWKKETQEAVDAATQDAINLAEAQKELLDRMNANAKIGNNPDQQQQQGKQQQGGQQPGQQQGAQTGGDKDKGQQQGGKAGQQGAGQKAGQEGQQGSGQGQPQAGGGSMQQMRADQAALKQGLEQLGKNLSEAGQRSAMVNKDVAAALARANMSMDQTMRAMQDANSQNPPSKEAEQALNDLNKLALELLKNGQQIEQSEQGSGLQQALEQLQQLAQQQSGLNGKSNSLLPMNLSQQAMSQQMGQLAREQRDIAQKLGGMNKGGARDDLLGRLDELVKEADGIARDLEGGRMNPQTVQRQERLFHKLLDAGKTMERDEVSEERESEAARALPPSVIRALKPGLFDNTDKFTAPTTEQLRDLPPAYRKLILEYFERLNRVQQEQR